jgi:hypothetical protein
MSRVNPENRKDHAFWFLPLEKGGQDGFDNVMAAKNFMIKNLP